MINGIPNDGTEEHIAQEPVGPNARHGHTFPYSCQRERGETAAYGQKAGQHGECAHQHHVGHKDAAQIAQKIAQPLLYVQEHARHEQESGHHERQDAQFRLRIVVTPLRDVHQNHQYDEAGARRVDTRAHCCPWGCRTADMGRARGHVAAGDIRPTARTSCRGGRSWHRDRC